ncbi:MAG TPA: hypothetical protein VKZ54_02240 [Membranihabitans sp.]|nr:hypothetical protein [Membranihabitans sp.]
MDCIQINVQKETAEKWRNASPARKALIEQKIEMELARDSQHRSKDKFIKFLDDLGQRMEERGLTEARLKDILADE